MKKILMNMFFGVVSAILILYCTNFFLANREEILSFYNEDELKMGLMIILFLFFILILFSLIPLQMAKRRNRAQFGWFVFSILFSPLLAIFILFCIGSNRKDNHFLYKN
jgi:hypothetical protein